jgi:hypothetical protein
MWPTRFLRIVSTMIFFTVIGLSLLAQAGDKETALYNFSEASGGYEPNGALIMDSSGNLYGVASLGGLSSECCGVIFELSPKLGGGWTYAVLYNFLGGTDSDPYGQLAMDAAGNLYGVADNGGEIGEVFELSQNASGTWTETVLYTITAVGIGPVVLDAAGNLYGTIGYGCANNFGCIFELSSVGGIWTFQDIYDFSGTDGSLPGGVALDGSGNLLGATDRGGSSANCLDGCGVVFALTKASGAWGETILHDFDGTDGSSPLGALTVGASGSIYGAAFSGGQYGFGTVFELKQTSGVWKIHTLHAFRDADGDGAGPDSGLVFYGGSLYGTTLSGGGGLDNCFGVAGRGCGSAFKLTRFGSAWKQTILHDFTGGRDGTEPEGVILDSSGNAFGVAPFGGSLSKGLVFELSPGSK